MRRHPLDADFLNFANSPIALIRLGFDSRRRKTSKTVKDQKIEDYAKEGRNDKKGFNVDVVDGHGSGIKIIVLFVRFSITNL